MWGLPRHSEKAEHRFCRGNLSAFIDGQLTGRESERVRRHLDRCQACQRELESLQRTVSLLRSLPRVPAPRSFAIPRSTPAPALPFWMRPWAYGALRVASAAAALLLVVALTGGALAGPGVDLAAGERVLRIAAEPSMEAAAPLGTPAPSEGMVALGAPAPAAAAAPNGAASEAEPSAEPMAGALEVMPPPTLTAEEAARATAAPEGRGGGAAATDTTVPTVQAPPVASARAGETVEAPAPEAAVAAAARPATNEPPLGEPKSLVESPGGAGREVADGYALRPWAAGVAELRQRIGGYPWGWWAAGSAMLLALLLTMTLWLRAKRARWP